MSDRREQLRATFLAAIMVISMIAMGAVGFAGTAAAEEHDGVLTVDDDFEDPGEYQFTSIQEAINNAEEGDTIEVEDGTYEESVTINKTDLTLEAAEGATPIVGESGEIPVLVDEAEDVTVEEDDFEFLSGIDVGADDVGVDEYPDVNADEFDFAVTEDGGVPDEGSFDEGDVFENIDAATDEAEQDESILVFAGEYDFEGALNDDDRAEGLEIVSFAGPGETDIVEVDGDRGISLREDGMVLQGFTITDEVQSTGDEMINIRGNDVEVRHNVIEEDVSVGSHALRSSSISGGESGVVIDSNEFNTDNRGLSFTGENGPHEDLTITNNVITGEVANHSVAVGDATDEIVVKSNEFLGDVDGDSLVITGDSGGVDNLEITNNVMTGEGTQRHVVVSGANSPEITDNTIRNSESAGIQLSADIDTEEPVDNAIVTGNLITGNKDGLVLFDGEGREGSNIDELNNNHIVNSERDAIANIGTDTTIDANDNWFGDSNFGDTSDLDGLLFEDDGTIDITQWAGAPIDPDASDD